MSNNCKLERSGIYIVAVSGGVDSVVLLDMLAKKMFGEFRQLIIAHVNHGIRDDSDEDEALVSKLAAQYGVQFEAIKLHLDKNASEDLARQKRYDFLRQIRDKYNASKIITAHHKGDVEETAVLNLLRGTGRRGLDPMSHNEDIFRPLINMSKKELINYALEHNLVWREDSTNTDTKYMRNYIRHNIAPSLLESENVLERVIHNASVQNYEIDQLVKYIAMWCSEGENTLRRARFVQLPHDVAKEVLMMQLRLAGFRQFSRRMIDDAVVFIKAGRAQSKIPLQKNIWLVAHKNNVSVYVAPQ